MSRDPDATLYARLVYILSLVSLSIIIINVRRERPLMNRPSVYNN